MFHFNEVKLEGAHFPNVVYVCERVMGNLGVEQVV